MKKRKFYFRTLVGAGLIAAAAAFPAFADNWIHQENGWVCKTADGYMQTGWYQDKNNGGKWYYLWPEAGNRLGCMQTGWLQKDGKWYFFDTRSGSSGAMLTRMAVDRRKMLLSGSGSRRSDGDLEHAFGWQSRRK